jgi:hypothetical protein
MGQLVAPKEGHERLGKGSEPFVKSLERRFGADRIANEHNHEIDKVVGAKARAKRTCS